MYTPQTFEQFMSSKLQEELNSVTNVALADVPTGMYRREQLPQISDFSGFMKHLTDNGVGVKSMKINPKTYKPTQKEFNDDKVMSLMKEYVDGNTPKPVIVSNDGYVLDGHHRWKAVYSLGYNDIDAHEIDMGIEEMITQFKDKPFTQTKKINESTKII